MLIVLDTNILASAVIKKQGNPAIIIKAWQNYYFDLVISALLFQEWQRVLTYKRILKYSYLDKTELLFLLNLIKSLSKMAVFDQSEIRAVIADDPSDDIILATALAGKADFIVSGDKHLLSLGEYKGIKIITAAELVKIFDYENQI